MEHVGGRGVSGQWDAVLPNSLVTLFLEKKRR